MTKVFISMQDIRSEFLPFIKKNTALYSCGDHYHQVSEDFSFKKYPAAFIENNPELFKQLPESIAGAILKEKMQGSIDGLLKQLDKSGFFFEWEPVADVFFRDQTARKLQGLDLPGMLSFLQSRQFKQSQASAAGVKMEQAATDMYSDKSRREQHLKDNRATMTASSTSQRKETALQPEWAWREARAKELHAAIAARNFRNCAEWLEEFVTHVAWLNRRDMEKKGDSPVRENS